MLTLTAAGAVFDFDAASNEFTPDPTSHEDCGNSCHVAVKAKDYIFHPYEKRLTGAGH